MATNTKVDLRQQLGPAILKPREIAEVLALPDRRKKRECRDAALLAVMLGTGTRVGECVRLTVDNVERTPGGKIRLSICCLKGGTAAPPRWRIVTLPEPMAKILVGYMQKVKPRWWLFPGYRNDHMSRRQAQHIVRWWMTKIGRGDITCHGCRHTFGSMVTKYTRSIFVAQKLLGHVDPQTTAMYYAAFEVSDADEAADLIAEAMSFVGKAMAPTRTPVLPTDTPQATAPPTPVETLLPTATATDMATPSIEEEQGPGLDQATDSLSPKVAKGRPRESVWNRFWRKVQEDPATGCWVWCALKIRGYGQFLVGGQARRVVDRRLVKAHHLAYRLLVGPIPSWLQIGHLCRNRACVNPAHLELITHHEKHRRDNSGKAGGAFQRNKTHCPQGHPYDEANTRFDSRGHRQCLACRRERSRQYTAQWKRVPLPDKQEE